MGEAELLERIGKQRLDRCGLQHPAPYFIAALANFLHEGLFGLDARAVNKNNLFNLKRQVTACHFDYHPAAERVTEHDELFRLKVLKELQNKVHIIVNAPRLFRLLGETEARHVWCHDPIFL